MKKRRFIIRKLVVKIGKILDPGEKSGGIMNERGLFWVHGSASGRTERTKEEMKADKG